MALQQYVQDYDERLPQYSGLGSALPAAAPLGGSTTAMTPQDKLYPYVKNVQVFACPSTTVCGNQAYGYHSNLLPGRALADVLAPSGTLGLCDSGNINSALINSCGEYKATASSHWEVAFPYTYTGAAQTSTYYLGPNGYRRIEPRHNDGLNVVFLDGHVKWQKCTDIEGPIPGNGNCLYDNQ